MNNIFCTLEILNTAHLTPVWNESVATSHNILAASQRFLIKREREKKKERERKDREA